MCVCVTSKQTRVLAAIARCETVSVQLGKSLEAVSVRSTAGGQDLRSLIVYELERLQNLCVNAFRLYCTVGFPPPDPCGSHETEGGFKSTTEKPWDTHTHTNHRSTPKSTSDPDLLYPSRNNLLQEKPTDVKSQIKERKWHQVDCVGTYERERRKSFAFGNLDQSHSHRKALLMRVVQEKCRRR